MPDYDNFTHGYIEALFFFAPEDEDVRNLPLSDESLARVEDLCAKFQAKHAALLAQYYKACENSNRRDYSPQELAGHDFYLTSNGNGTGFWDRGFGIVGETLAGIARNYVALELFKGRDGLAHVPTNRNA
jgi:hypothetical protein